LTGSTGPALVINKYKMATRFGIAITGGSPAAGRKQGQIDAEARLDVVPAQEESWAAAPPALAGPVPSVVPSEARPAWQGGPWQAACGARAGSPGRGCREGGWALLLYTCMLGIV
jgi:hypothetical protein